MQQRPAFLEQMEYRYQQPCDHFQNLDQVIQMIASAIQPYAIYCVNRHHAQDTMVYADLIVVLPDSYRRPSIDLERMVEFALLGNYHISCSLHQCRQFYSMLAAGHVYYSLVCDENALLYRSSEYQSIRKPTLADDRVERITQRFYTGLHKARAFLNSAERACAEDLPFATYLLHQTVELSLCALHRSLCGQQRKTHHLPKLLQMCNRITADLSRCMNDGSAEAATLLQLLDESYLDYRYTDEFTVSSDQFQKLLLRVQQLHAICESCFCQWIMRYKVMFAMDVENR